MNEPKDKLVYIRPAGKGEATKVELEFDSFLDIFQYRILCMRLAKAIGYSDSNVTEAFGGFEIFDSNILHTSKVETLKVDKIVNKRSIENY